MSARWSRLVSQFARGIWFRASMFTLLGVVLTVAAWVLSALLPDSLQVELGQGAVGSVLQILATSMLAVTTFSLTVMVSAYSSAATTGTPRSTQLLINDRTSQNALSTFIGAFAFAIVGIVSLSLNIYTETGRTLLFLGSLLVIAAVVWTLLRWVSFLTRFGRMSDIIDRVERAAHDSMVGYAKAPLLGTAVWSEPTESARPIGSDVSGFVVRVDVAALQRAAEAHDLQVWVVTRAGARATPHRPVALVHQHDSAAAQEDLPDSLVTAVQRAFVVERHRTFQQDPRLGLIALSEIASRALSAATNDPGTAIEVFGALQRVLTVAMDADPAPKVRFDRVYLHSITPEDMLVDAFRPAARDGAGIIEVAMRLQIELARMASHANADWRAPLEAMADEALERSRHALAHQGDLDALAQARSNA